MIDADPEDDDLSPQAGGDDASEPVRPDLDIALHRQGSPPEDDDPSQAALHSIANPATGI
jgi:hypothetical protein